MYKAARDPVSKSVSLGRVILQCKTASQDVAWILPLMGAGTLSTAPALRCAVFRISAPDVALSLKAV